MRDLLDKAGVGPIIVILTGTFLEVAEAALARMIEQLGSTVNGLDRHSRQRRRPRRHSGGSGYNASKGGVVPPEEHRHWLRRAGLGQRDLPGFIADADAGHVLRMPGMEADSAESTLEHGVATARQTRLIAAMAAFSVA